MKADDRGVDKMPTDPSPEEIAALCLQIQANWTDFERRRRLGRTHDMPKPDLLHRVAIRDITN